ncbi:hypothetical protein HC13_0003 [Escherichia phage HC13]|uniref:Uncharacterized protein n=1 Tax=Escherichia phage HC13 TaxID=2912291 RepID=A0A9E7SBB5_9CAUD|nr:hypothetical protein HC13_0003 [Escherichia phage HC13]
MSKIYAIYYVVPNSWGDDHILQEPCYYNEDEAKQALAEAQAEAKDPWSGVYKAYMEVIQVV